ncbi:MAG: hypothetical protein M3N46_14035, partial [Actinomycetota bacterium]|nr:hypothetical protein [Actinomycetota bacterium]
MTVDRGPRASLDVARTGRARRWAVSRMGSIPLISVGVFLVARLITSGFVLWLTTQTGAGSEAGASPSFATLSSVWDGRWYEQIAEHGYPLHLPISSDGRVRQNAWAFLPAYPYLTRALAVLLGGQWSVVAIVVSVCFGT